MLCMEKEGTAQTLRISILFPGSVLAPHTKSLISQACVLVIGVFLRSSVPVTECAEFIV